jgi:hypothetical protein
MIPSVFAFVSFLTDHGTGRGRPKAKIIRGVVMMSGTRVHDFRDVRPEAHVWARSLRFVERYPHGQHVED